MPRSLNRVTLLGHLGKDAETKYTGNGTPVSSFSLATSRRWKSGDEWKEETDWHNIVLWQNEKVAEYLTKGKPVLVEGRLQTRSYDDRDGKKRYVTEVVAENVILLGGGEGKAAPRTTGGKPAPAMDVSDDDVPF